MPSVTHSHFNVETEGLEVAKAFADGIRGKTVIVTGGNRSGIGFATARSFASQSPAHLILAGRTPSKLQECIDALKAEFPGVDYRALRIDLASQKSVRAAAAEVLGWADIPTIDIIVNTAGVMAIQEQTITDDGVEMHFATNHIGHFLFFCLVSPKLIKAAEGKPKGATRVVNVSSMSPSVTNMRWSDMNFEKKSKDLPEDEIPNIEFLELWGYEDVENMTYIPVEAYGQSKVANVLFSIGANRRLLEKHGILSVSVHPGLIDTEIARDFPAERFADVKEMVKKGVFTYKSLGAGAATSLVAALDPALAIGVGESRDGKENYGTFLADCQITDIARPGSVSSANAEKLWKLSEELVKEEFSW
uniref:Ketoreductase (KR) domain-containing protein n=1 Tax=Bionectria ochroleuca TaxID=29856 RepID=A0A0B7JZY5_BIOOC